MYINRERRRKRVDSLNNTNTNSETQYGTFRIENIVASVKFDADIDLDMIDKRFIDVEKKDNFPGIIIRLSNPKTTVLLFKSAKMVLTGLKDKNDVLLVVKKIFRRLRDIDIEINGMPEIKINNVVASVNLGKKINLDVAALVLDRAIFEPEVFPGLIHRTGEPKGCFLIFSSGKMICTGLKDEKEIMKMVKQVATKLKENNALLLGDELEETADINNEILEILEAQK
ncbi:MAG: TATA-box-binding protein [Promethearchaeota archaeon]